MLVATIVLIYFFCFPFSVSFPFNSQSLHFLLSTCSLFPIHEGGNFCTRLFLAATADGFETTFMLCTISLQALLPATNINQELLCFGTHYFALCTIQNLSPPFTQYHLMLLGSKRFLPNFYTSCPSTTKFAITLSRTSAKFSDQATVDGQQKFRRRLSSTSF